MGIEVSRPQNHEIEDGRSYFFDTNIWLYLTYPQFDSTPSHIIERYSDFYLKILQAKARILSSSTVIGEYSNRLLKIEFDKKNETLIRDGKTPVKWKKFRQLEEGIEAISHISKSVDMIISQSELVAAHVTKKKLRRFAKELGSLDYSDNLILSECTANEAFLVTNDSDFVNVTIPVNVISLRNDYFR